MRKSFTEIMRAQRKARLKMQREFEARETERLRIKKLYLAKRAEKAALRANLSMSLVTRRDIVNDILREIDTKIIPSIKSELT